MQKRTRLLVAMLFAVFASSCTAGSATANRSIEVRGGPNVQAEGRLRFIGTEAEAGNEFTCDVTLRRTIASTIPKAPGTLFGKVTGIRINRGGLRSPNCGHGFLIREVDEIVPLLRRFTEPRTQFPCIHGEDVRGNLTWDCSGANAALWKLIYLSFQSTLPRITGINFRIQGVQFLFEVLDPFGFVRLCLYEGAAYGLIVVRPETSTITEARAVRELTSLTKVKGDEMCPTNGTLEATFNIRPTLTIRLV
jgi:hypothetical protein